MHKNNLLKLQKQIFQKLEIHKFNNSHKIKICLFALFLIILIIFYFLRKSFIKSNSKNIIENYDHWDLNINNQNWNKKWRGPYVAYNNPYYQDIPRSSVNDPNLPEYILQIFKEPLLKKTLKSIKNTSNKNISTNNIKFHYVNISPIELYKLNKASWFDRSYEYQVYNPQHLEKNLTDFITIKSCIDDINIILNDFIKKFNKIFTSDKSEIPIKKFYSESTDFDIIKYKIHYIKQSKSTNDNCNINYGIIFVIVRNRSITGPAIFMDVIKTNTNQLIYKDFDIIGYYNTDQLYLFPGLDKNSLYYNLNPVFRREIYDQANWYNNIPRLARNQRYNWGNVLKNQYTCFNNDPKYYHLTNGTNQQIQTYVYNQGNCEATTDVVGLKKCKGIWQRPCIDNSECKYYQSNKNYKNNHGKCNTSTGYCEFPRGMKSLGYSSHQPNSKISRPLCYNCKSVNKSGQRKIITALSNCCEDQKDKNKYPYLNGPDYAFPNDEMSRLKTMNN